MNLFYWWSCFPGVLHLDFVMTFVLGSPGGEGFHVEFHFNPADDICSWLLSLWVASMVSSIRTLLTMPLLCSLGSESLSCWVVFAPCWCCLFSAFQDVNASHAKLHFNYADDALAWLASWWVASGVTWMIWILLTLPILGVPGSELLQYQHASNPMTCLFLISGCRYLVYLATF